MSESIFSDQDEELHLANHALEDTKKNPPNNFLFLFFWEQMAIAIVKQKKSNQGTVPLCFTHGSSGHQSN